MKETRRSVTWLMESIKKNCSKRAMWYERSVVVIRTEKGMLRRFGLVQRMDVSRLTTQIYRGWKRMK